MRTTTPIDARALSVVRGGRSLLADVDLQVGEGELVVLVGPNGAGKSTLVRTLLGRVVPDHGSVTSYGQPVRSLRAVERAERMAWLPQRHAVAEPIQVVDQVMAARFRLSESRAQRRQASLAALERVGLADMSHRDATTLSGGEAQRVGLACLVAQESRMWLLDEPANHLDPAVQEQVLSVVLHEWRRGRPVVLVTHDPDRVLSRVRGGPARVVGLRDGRVLMRADSSDDTLAEQLSDVYGVPMVSVAVGGARRLLFQAEP